MRRLAAAALFLACSAGSARADDTDAPANERLKGFRYVIKPGFTYQKSTTTVDPDVKQDVTFAVSNHVGWGIPLGPIVLSPGASVPVYFFDAGRDDMLGGTQHQPGATLAVLGEVEMHLPLRWISLFGFVGAGGAFHFGSNQQGGVFRAGGGLMVYPRSWIGVGVQAAFLTMSNAARGPDSALSALEMTWPIELRF